MRMASPSPPPRGSPDSAIRANSRHSGSFADAACARCAGSMALDRPPLPKPGFEINNRRCAAASQAEQSRDVVRLLVRNVQSHQRSCA